ncbi:signal peptidase II [Kushneria aurantia]|uniref:Lipoprotein signal peptidase n=1 Tax=Kushneria aurantia TaxID=504092 RepID=A0ABV6FYQ9_9GAMM|nr:signal peptidase II [Kushneria aurantia]
MPERGQVSRYAHARYTLRWLLLSVLVIALDLALKAWASAALIYARPLEVTPFFNLTLLHNTGAAFSFLAEHAGWQRWLFALVAMVAVTALTIWLARLSRYERLMPISIALIIGGALGNLFDRLVHGYVIDYLSFHWQGWYYPAFNLADAAITVGAIGIIIESFRAGRRERAQTEQHHER